jgi:penicillin-binding protein 1A
MTAPLSAGSPLSARSGRRHGSPPAPRPRRRRWFRQLLGALFGIATLVALAGGAAVGLAWARFAPDLPSIAGLQSYVPPLMTRVYAGNGQVLDELATQRRILVPFSAIPRRLQDAFLAAEDQNFWIHPGIDPVAIMRAGVWDLMHAGSGRRPIGASTITMQVAKNMLLHHRMNMVRKIEEAILALRIDQSLPKQRILDIYLNEIYLGNGAYGVAAAAQTYFGKPLDQLSIAECASLAALPKAPHNYNPLHFPKAALIRRNWVIDRMADDGSITRAEATAAKAAPLLPAVRSSPAPIPGGDWFASAVQSQLVARFGTDLTMEGGLTVETSLDPRLQAEATQAVRDGLMTYDRRMGGWRGPVAQLPAAGLADWIGPLSKIVPPAGMLSAWRLAVVLPGGQPDAPRVGWLDPVTASGSAPGTAAPGTDGAQPLPHTATLSLGGEVWRHPMTPGGDEQPAFAGLAQMVRPGDVVMIRPPDASTAVAVLRQVPKVQGALVSLDPTSGRVLAMVGGWSYRASQFNRAIQAQRQPGSSFKPMVYLAAMEQGYSPSSRFLNAPIVVNLGAGGMWRPHNYEDNFGGPTPLRIGLEESLNLVTIRLAERMGMAAVAKTAEAFGMVDHLPQVLPASLGAVDTTVMREAGAYASLADGGRRVEPSVIDSVQDPEGHVVWRPSGLSCVCDSLATPPQITDHRERIADPQSTFQVVKMMEGVVKHGTGVTAGAGLNRPIAGKTGTTENFQDAWFSGFTPQLVTVVWVGFDQPATLGHGQQGAAVAAPIWHQFMAAALKDRPAVPFPMPPDLTLAQWDSGHGMRTDAFKPGQVPGASTMPPIGGETGTALATAPPGAPGSGPAAGSSPAGVDSSLGGLY